MSVCCICNHVTPIASHSRLAPPPHGAHRHPSGPATPAPTATAAQRLAGARAKGSHQWRGTGEDKRAGHSQTQNLKLKSYFKPMDLEGFSQKKTIIR